jgi:hypothetical protein
VIAFFEAQIYFLRKSDKMSSKEFLTLEEVVEYLDVLSDDELSELRVVPASFEEDHRLTDEEDVNENYLGDIIPADTCGKISLTLPHRGDDGERERKTIYLEKRCNKEKHYYGKRSVKYFFSSNSADWEGWLVVRTSTPWV